MNGNLVALPDSQLVAIAPNWSAMRTAIANCDRVDEIKDVADKAVALRAYFAQSRDVDNELQAMRIRLRAERRLGQLIEFEQEAGRLASRQNGGANVTVSAVSTPLTLADHGIPRNRSAMAQNLARVQEDQFEAALSNGKPSARSLAALAPKRGGAQTKREAPIDVRAVLKTWGMIRDFAAAVKDETLLRPGEWAAHPGIQPFQLAEITDAIPVIQRYLSALQEHRHGSNK
jgi:hypothetical protein